MKVIIILLVSSMTFAAIPTAVTNCISNQLITFTAATYSVEPQVEVEFTTSLYGTANQKVELGNVQIKTRWNDYDLYETNDAENDIYNVNDLVVYSHTSSQRSFIKGKIVVQYNFQTQERVTIGCAQVQYTL